MNLRSNTSKLLGIAFLLQFFTSLISEAALLNPLFVSGDIGKSMIKFVDNAGLVRANILLEMITAMGIIFLGVVLFTILKSYNEKMALTALGFYIVEGAVLVVSRMSTFSLLRISQEYATTGHPTFLKTMGNLANDSINFGITLHMLLFCFGAMLFYYLLFKSGIIPNVVSLWGLIAVFPCLLGTLMAIFGYTPPIFLYVPYVPFEFVIGIWILLKGINNSSVN